MSRNAMFADLRAVDQLIRSMVKVQAEYEFDHGTFVALAERAVAEFKAGKVIFPKQKTPPTADLPFPSGGPAKDGE